MHDRKASPSLNALLDKYGRVLHAPPPLSTPPLPSSSPTRRTGLVALDEASAEYVSIDKDKVATNVKGEGRWRSQNGCPRWPSSSTGSRRRPPACCVNLDEWSHVAATFDGKTMITYVNGRRADYSTLDPPLQPDEYLQTQGDLSIGGPPGKYAWHGLVDSVRVWNVCLTWEEIRRSMNDTLLGTDTRRWSVSGLTRAAGRSASTLPRVATTASSRAIASSASCARATASSRPRPQAKCTSSRTSSGCASGGSSSALGARYRPTCCWRMKSANGRRLGLLD